MELFPCGTAPSQAPLACDESYQVGQPFLAVRKQVAPASCWRAFQQGVAPDASRPMHIETRLSLWDSQSWLSSHN
jgi:hypothetical protein